MNDFSDSHMLAEYIQLHISHATTNGARCRLAKQKVLCKSPRAKTWKSIECWVNFGEAPRRAARVVFWGSDSVKMWNWNSHWNILFTFDYRSLSSLTTLSTQVSDHHHLPDSWIDTLKSNTRCTCGQTVCVWVWGGQSVECSADRPWGKSTSRIHLITRFSCD